MGELGCRLPPPPSQERACLFWGFNAMEVIKYVLNKLVWAESLISNKQARLPVPALCPPIGLRRIKHAHALRRPRNMNIWFFLIIPFENLSWNDSIYKKKKWACADFMFDGEIQLDCGKFHATLSGFVSWILLSNWNAAIRTDCNNLRYCMGGYSLRTSKCH